MLNHPSMREIVMVNLNKLFRNEDRAIDLENTI
jgi:hypothetical protein